MDEYIKANKPDNQERVIDGICINPNLRNDFNNTKHSDRPDIELADWWNNAYILERDYQHSDDSYTEYVKRITGYGSELGYELESAEAWNLSQEKSKATFLASYPEGKAYLVRVLDSGAWDRSRLVGTYPSLDEALVIAKQVKE